MTIDPTWKLVISRIEDALREIAVLFMALAPLDVVLASDRPHAIRGGLIFVGIGVGLFVLVLNSERKRIRG